MSKLSLKKMYMGLSCLMATLLLILFLAILKLQAASQEQTQANVLRYQSYLLADELRQSSDDLTRLARTYVVSANPKWEEQYFEILDIRNGKKPRPEHPERIFWDFEAADISVPRRGIQAPLRDLMEKAGFTQQEFALLNQAEDKSNALVHTETVAMNAVKGLFEDSQGNFTARGEPDQAMAISMMHNQAYHNEKASIMEPVNQFLAAVDERTSKTVQEAQKNAQTWLYVLLFICLLTFLVLGIALLMAWQFSQRLLGAEPSLLNEMAQRQAEGHLEVDLGTQKRTGVAASMQTVTHKLREVLGVVQQGALGVSAVSDQLSNASVQLSAGMAIQSDRVSMIASASMEMSQTAIDIAKNVSLVQQSSVATLEMAQVGGSKVGQASQSMDEILKHITLASEQSGALEEKANEVQEVVGIISSIADQTNLLALNAAIEAARAGEVGRGFAVVADEVRSLAERSNKATHEINTIIVSMQESVNQVVDSMSQVSSRAVEGSRISEAAAHSFTQIVSSVQALQEHVTQNAASIDEMSSTSEQITADIQDIADVSHESLDSAQHIAESANELVENMRSLTQSAAYFKL